MKSIADEVVEYRKKNPCLTLQQVGDHFSRSRERIRQILFENGERTTNIRYGKTVVICPNCGGRKSRNGKFCQQCDRQNRKIPISCPICGNIFMRSQADTLFRITRQNRQHFFCSEKCNGSYSGRHYGFGAHPGTINRKQKWDYTKVYELRDATNWGCQKLSQALGIPSSTIGVILKNREALS